MVSVISEVYEDEGYMVPYMWAAILIYPFWPSMVNHIALFRNEFLKVLPTQARVLEMASGHGVMSLLAAEERSDIKLEGIDISPPAVAISNRLLSVSGHGNRVTFEVKDALEIGQVNGFQVLVEMTTYVKGFGYQTTERVTGISEKAPPPGVYGPPKGYIEKEELNREDLQ